MVASLTTPFLYTHDFPEVPANSCHLKLNVPHIRDKASGIVKINHVFKEVHRMTITLIQLLLWIVIAAVVGFVGELIARRRAPSGIVGATILGFLAIFLVVGILHFSIVGEPVFEGVPIISSIIAAALLVFIWSAFAYRRMYRR